MVLAKSCGITSVAAILAQGLGSSFGTLRQQLREWCYDAADKKGVHRQELDVTLCFGPLLGWIVSKWPHGECRLALGRDATTVADRFTVLCVSVLYRGCAIPVAWKLLRGGEKGSWQPYWKALFTCLQASVRQSMDGDRAGRSRLVCPVALSSPGRLGLASVPAHQAFGAKSVRWAQSASTGFRTWCPSQEPPGVGWWIALWSGQYAVRGSPAGRKATPMLGWW